jgi:hypothetical protein
MEISELKKLALERLHQIKEMQYLSMYGDDDERTRQVRMEAIAETQRKIKELAE